MLLFILAFLVVQAEPLYLHVSGILEQPKATIQLEGEVESFLMLPNGEQQWVGMLDTEKHHFWNIHIQSEQKTLFQGIVRNHKRHIHLGYDDQNKSLQPYSQPGTRNEHILRDQQWLWWRGIWFVSIWVLIEILYRVPKKQHKEDITPAWVTPIFLGVLACLWMKEQLWNTGLSGVQYDALGTYWFADQVSTWDLLHDPNSNWPHGTTYKRLDSFLFFFISIFLSWIPTSIWLPIFSVSAITLNGWMASLLAQELGAKRKASWIAGITFMFHGITASALLEGHVYHLLLPWLPLCFLFAWRATKTQKTIKNSIYTSVFWFLCLLTSAYLGLAATIAILIIWIAQKGWNIKETYVGMGFIVLLSIGYVTLYAGGEALSSGRDAASMMVGSINLSNFLGFTPHVDQELHAQSLGILSIPFILAFATHRYTYKRQNIHVIWIVGLVSLSFGLGCFVSFASVTPLFPMPLLWLSDLPLFRSIGFPIRLSWPFLMCIGILASLTASKIKHLHLLLSLIIIEALVSTQLPSRQETVQYPLPDVYKQIQEASLELYPTTPSGKQHSDLPMWFSAYSCFFQTQHNNPIAENCVSTIPNAHTRIPLSQNFVQQLISGNSNNAWNILEQHQFSSILLYPDLYTPGDYKRLVHTLQGSDTQASTQIWYMERYAPPNNDVKVQADSISWGSTVLGTTQTTLFRISSPTPLSHLTINGERHSIQKEAVTELYRAQCIQTLTSKSTIEVFNKNNDIIWSGSFYPAVSNESLYIDVQTGWQLASSYTARNPMNKEVGIQARSVWILILSFGVVLLFCRYFYPIGDGITHKENTDIL